MKEKKLYMIAIVGAIICFIGDNLLGFFKPAADFGNKFLCINFSSLGFPNAVQLFSDCISHCHVTLNTCRLNSGFSLGG